VILPNKALNTDVLGLKISQLALAQVFAIDVFSYFIWMKH